MILVLCRLIGNTPVLVAGGAVFGLVAAQALLLIQARLDGVPCEKIVAMGEFCVQLVRIERGGIQSRISAMAIGAILLLVAVLACHDIPLRNESMPLDKVSIMAEILLRL